MLIFCFGDCMRLPNWLPSFALEHSEAKQDFTFEFILLILTQ